MQASQSSLTRYVRITLTEAGVDTDKFTPYSCRHAATSAAYRRQVPLASILTAAGWTGKDCFQRFYNRPTKRLTQVTNFIPSVWEKEPE